MAVRQSGGKVAVERRGIGGSGKLKGDGREGGGTEILTASKIMKKNTHFFLIFERLHISVPTLIPGRVP